MAATKPKVDKLLMQFFGSAYFKKFELTLGIGEDILSKNVFGVLGQLGITHQDVQLLSSSGSVLKEGIEMIAKRKKATVTLEDLICAVEALERRDARIIIFKFLNKCDKSKSKSKWWAKDFFKSRKSHGFEGDNVSLSSETTMQSASSMLSIASTATVDSGSSDGRQHCQDWISACEQEDPNIEEELCLGKESNEQKANVVCNRETRAINTRQRIKVVEDSNNNVALQLSSGVIVIANNDEGDDWENGVTVTKYLKSKKFPASLLDLSNPLTTIMTCLENAEKIVVVLTPQLAALARQLCAIQNIPSQGYEFDTTCACMNYLLQENFMRLRSPRIILVSFHKASDYGEIPITLKAKVYNMNDSKARKDLQFRIAGEEKLKLSALGTRVKVTPRVFSARSHQKATETKVQS